MYVYIVYQYKKDSAKFIAKKIRTQTFACTDILRMQGAAAENPSHTYNLARTLIRVNWIRKNRAVLRTARFRFQNSTPAIPGVTPSIADFEALSLNTLLKAMPVDGLKMW